MSDMKFITATIVFEIVASSVGGIPGRILVKCNLNVLNSTIYIPNFVAHESDILQRKIKYLCHLRS